MSWEPDYITVAELKSFLRIEDEVDDLEIGAAITAASRVIDEATSRQFGVVAAAEERTYDLDWDRELGLWVAEIDDLMTTTDLVVTVSGSAVASSDYLLLPRNAAAEGRPWEELGVQSGTSPTIGAGPLTVLVEGIWGWTSCPTVIKQAAKLQASRVFKRRDSPFGVAGSPDLGNELRLLAKVDADVEVMIRKFRRNAMVA